MKEYEAIFQSYLTLGNIKLDDIYKCYKPIFNPQYLLIPSYAELGDPVMRDIINHFKNLFIYETSGGTITWPLTPVNNTQALPNTPPQQQQALSQPQPSALQPPNAPSNTHGPGITDGNPDRAAADRDDLD
jgi:hypothetical protein